MDNLYYAVKNKNDLIREESASGGFFSIIAEYVLNKGGVVYGAKLENDGEVHHVRIESMENLCTIRGSKYVQSNMEGILKNIQEDVKSGYLVLFSGTPCQCAAAKAVLGERENLILVDLICHGVSSPKVFKAYWNMLERQNGKIEYFKFRDKEYSWIKQKWSVKYKNGKKDSISYEFRSYKEMYYKTILHRESCFKCPFTSVNRVTDFTMGDFWGIEKVDYGWLDEKGVSLVIVHSVKALEIWKELSEKILIREVKKEDCLQPQLCEPTKNLFPNSSFWNEFLKDNDYKRVMKKYGWPSRTRRLKDMVKKVLWK